MPGPSPRVRTLEWGRVEVEHPGGEVRAYKDAKLYPGGSRAWDWNETGTSHTPGVQPADVEELLEGGTEAVVLGRGVHERLEVMARTRRRLVEAGVEIHALATPAAVERYEELREAGVRVAGLFHTTC